MLKVLGRTRLLPSFEMRLPGAQQTVVDTDKLRGYCLNPSHPRGRHKARVFASALRILPTDAEWLQEKLLAAVLAQEAVPGEADEYSHRYSVDFECVHQDYRATVQSGWIIRRGEIIPRLTTCYVLSNKEAYE